jgi:hypothetical protein
MGAKFRGHGGPCLEVGERLDKERGGGKNLEVNEAFVGGVVDTRLRYENKAAKIQLSLGSRIWGRFLSNRAEAKVQPKSLLI